MFEVLHLEEHYNVESALCHLCKACRDTPGCLFTDFAMNAALRATRVTSRSFRDKYAAGLMASPLLLIAGFCIYKCMFDIMHILDLGIYQSTLPSVMVQITARGSPHFRGATLQARYNHAYRKYKRWVRRNKVQAVIRHRFKYKQWKKVGQNVFSRGA